MTYRLARCLAPAVAAAALTVACGTDNGTGTVVITTWGEEYIEDELPSDAFPHDHWSVKYSRFLVVYHAVTLADDDGDIVAELDHPLVFDMTKKAKGKPKTLATFELEAKAWPNLSYQLGPITDDAQPGDLATRDDVRLLQEDDASVHVEGVATSPDGVNKSFSWSFSPATLFQSCHGEQDGKEVEGVLVTNGGTQEVELTVHGDHFFYDDLQSEEGAPRFQAIADADANDDGEVTLEELDRVPLYTIPAQKGSYGTGALGNVDTLGQYERTLARTIGHYRGEGSCNSKEVEP
ncbi:MAG: hypothetical protein JW940_18570 [Polyangiaceae bacterium]|nr:hypothetical protein [Polyangiaceae bacterium]